MKKVQSILKSWASWPTIGIKLDNLAFSGYICWPVKDSNYKFFKLFLNSTLHHEFVESTCYVYTLFGVPHTQGRVCNDCSFDSENYWVYGQRNLK